MPEANILLVEDDPNQLEAYRQTLEDEGYEVTTAMDGRDALKKLDEPNASIDLVVLDIAMIGMDGIELIGKIAAKYHDSLPMIVYTAYAHYKDNFMTWLAEHYIIKSSDPTILLKKIAEVLAERAKK